MDANIQDWLQRLETARIYVVDALGWVFAAVLTALVGALTLAAFFAIICLIFWKPAILLVPIGFVICVIVGGLVLEFFGGD